jgi:HEAT repeat protein
LTADDLELTATLKVRCGDGSHDAFITLTAWGMVDFFTPCSLLPPTVKKLAGTKFDCGKYLHRMVQRLIQNFLLGELDELEAKENVPHQALAFLRRWQGRLMEGAMAKLAQEGFDLSTENALKAALHLGDKHLQCAAAVLAGAQKQTSLIPDLLEVARKQSSFCLQLAILWALTEMPDSSALNFLHQNFVRSDLSPLFKIKIAKALGQIGDDSSLEYLTEVLRDENVIVRRAGAKALEQLGDVRAIPALVQTLKHEKDEEVREAVVKTLLSIGEPTIPYIIEELPYHYFNRYSLELAELLVNFGEAAIPHLIKALERDNISIREAAIDILASIGKPAVKVLVDALKSDNPLVRSGAGETLRKMEKMDSGSFREAVHEINAKRKGELQAKILEKRAKILEKWGVLKK